MRRSEPGGAVAEFARYLRIETVGGMVLLAVTAVALVWANSPWADSYQALRDARVGPHLLHLNLSIGQWAQDGALALFFFVVGLELKRELVLGELSQLKSALLPVIAALGGVAVPAVFAAVVVAGTPGAGRVWAIPMATDVAFALGVLALTASAMPAAARVFLLSLAVVDDLAAIVMIAVLFSHGLNVVALVMASGLAAGYGLAQRRRVRSPLLYVPLAGAVWVALHSGGVHATLAGVILGLLTRVRPDLGEAQAPGLRLEHRLQPVSAGFAVPVFALFAAGVPLDAAALRALGSDRIALAVVVGLLVGKFVGILGACLLAVWLRLAAKPPDVGWADMAAVAMLGGVGFTVSLLIADLALAGAAAERAKAAVLGASTAAALLAAGLLVWRGRLHRAAREAAG